MSTPQFLPQDASTLKEVRFYTPLDPYHFTVDNRPLHDMQDNIESLARGGIDSARRAAALTQVSMSSVFDELAPKSTNTYTFSGLEVDYLGTDYIRVNRGAVYFLDVINESDSAMIRKQALKVRPENLSFTRPTSAGNAVVHLVVFRSTTLDLTTMNTSQMPYIDAQNPYLPSTLLMSELELALLPGTVAPTGSAVPPSVPSGWMPLYTVTLVSGISQPQIAFAEDVLPANEFSHRLSLSPATTAGAILSDVHGVPTHTFNKESVASAVFMLPVSLKGVNPYRSFKLKILYSGTTADGHYALQMRARSFSTGQVISGTNQFTSPVLQLTGTGTAGELKEAVTAYEYSLPNSLFSGFVGSTWGVTQQYVPVTLSREVADALDTSTGNLRIHEIVAVQ